jgi:hypothetical protein
VAAAAAHLRKTISAPLPPAEQSKLDQNLHNAWRQLGELEGQKAWNNGRAMSTENAIQHALSD